MSETKLSNTAADKAVRQVQKAVDGMCALQDMGLGIDLIQIILDQLTTLETRIEGMRK